MKQPLWCVQRSAALSGGECLVRALEQLLQVVLHWHAHGSGRRRGTRGACGTAAAAIGVLQWQAGSRQARSHLPEQ